MAFAHLDLGGFLQASGEDRAAKARQIDEICRDTGFLVLRNHGVPEAVIANVWAAAAMFLHCLRRSSRRSRHLMRAIPMAGSGPTRRRWRGRGGRRRRPI